MKQTKFVPFQGKCKWAKLDIPDTRFIAEGKWSINIYPDADSMNKIQELKKEGWKNTIKKDDDGEFVVFSRPTQKTLKGRLKAFTPPEIMDKDGKPLPRGTRIGNGSDVTLNIEVYYYKNPQKEEKVATRLASVRIDNLVEFSRDDYQPEQLRSVKGLAEVPPQLF